MRIVNEKAGHTVHPGGKGTRWLPPGYPFEYWQQYKSAFEEFNGSFRYFLQVWKVSGPSF